MELLKSTDIPTPPPFLTPVKSSRPLWVELLLHFLSFGVYSCVWLCIKAKELNLLLGKNNTPWLWFFVPFFFVFQLFALPVFFGQLFELEKKAGLPLTNKWVFFIWGALLCGSTLLFGYMEVVYGDTSWVMLPTLLLNACLFTWLQYHFNGIYQSLNDIKYQGSTRNLSWVEWFYLAPLVFIMMANVFVVFDSLTTNILADLPDGTRYVDPDNRYQLTVKGNGWQQVDIGTFSDGTADFEMKSAASDVYITVISHDINDSMDGVARFRMSNIAGDSVLSSCQETRRLVNKPLTVIAFIQCKDNNLLYPRVYTVRLFKTETGVVEIYGHIGGNKKIQEQYAPQIQSIADSFLPL